MAGWPAGAGLPLPTVAGVEIEHVAVHARGLRFHVALAGPREAEPLVLLHGWPQHWYEWRGVLPELALTRRCVMPDLRGLGWSDAPGHGYEKENLADDVIALLDALGIAETDLIAHDWGGWVGFLLALREPSRVRRYLALNILPPWPSPQRQRPVRELLRLARLSYQLLLAAPLLAEQLMRRTRIIERMLTAGLVHPEAFGPGDLEAFSRVISEPARARASSLIYRTFLAHEALPILRGLYAGTPLRVPTHLLFGEQDFALGEAPETSALAREGDALTVEPVADAGHFIAEERPDLVIARARELLGA